MSLPIGQQKPLVKGNADSEYDNDPFCHTFVNYFLESLWSQLSIIPAPVLLKS